MKTIYRLWVVAILAMILIQANLISHQINLIIEILMEPIRIERKELKDKLSASQV